MKRGSKVAGHRGYYLKGPGVRLALALIQYGINFL
jgi:seryl-tRNA synthetase